MRAAAAPVSGVAAHHAAATAVPTCLQLELTKLPALPPVSEPSPNAQQQILLASEIASEPTHLPMCSLLPACLTAHRASGGAGGAAERQAAR